jgi:hypothetical protein
LSKILVWLHLNQHKPCRGQVISPHACWRRRRPAARLQPQTSSVPAPDAVDCASMHSGINAELSGEALDLCLPLLWGKLRGKV